MGIESNDGVLFEAFGVGLVCAPCFLGPIWSYYRPEARPAAIVLTNRERIAPWVYREAV